MFFVCGCELLGLPLPAFAAGSVAELTSGQWSGGAGIGSSAIRFLFGLSAQAKYWWNIPGTETMRLVIQAGIGFIRAGIKDTDSGIANTYGSFLIPIGIGIDHPFTERLSLTADVFLNVTSLGETVRASGREFDLHTNSMPALYLGVRF